MRLRCAHLLLLLLMIAPPARAEGPATLTVFAAASLTDAFEAVAPAFEETYPGVDVVFSFGGSSTLAAQILEGAPADVFASANFEQMQRLADAGMLAGQVEIFAHNRLVLIAPHDNPAGIETVGDLARDNLKLVLAAPAVPVRVYTEQMLEAAAAQPEFGDDFYARVLANIVSEEENVRRVAAKVALGEADAGIVYASDVTADLAGQLAVFPIPDAINVVADYPVAALARTAHPDEARAFVDFMLSPDAQSILRQSGLIPVMPDAPDQAGGDMRSNGLLAHITRAVRRVLSGMLIMEPANGG